MDWVLVEFRDATTTAAATIARQEAFLLSDGSITAMDGSSFNRNGQVNNSDKNDFWLLNLNKVCQVP